MYVPFCQISDIQLTQQILDLCNQSQASKVEAGEVCLSFDKHVLLAASQDVLAKIVSFCKGSSKSVCANGSMSKVLLHKTSGTETYLLTIESGGV